MNPLQALDTLQALSDKYHRQYPPGAYVLVLQGLEWAQQKGSVEHMTGQELSQAIFLLSIDLWGPVLAKIVWEELGLQSSEDLGQMVYHLVESNLMSKEEEDSISHFDGVLSVEDFDKVKPIYRFKHEKKQWKTTYEFSDKFHQWRFRLDEDEEEAE